MVHADPVAVPQTIQRARNALLIIAAPIIAGCVSLPVPPPAGLPRVTFNPVPDFSEAAVKSGVKAVRADCEKTSGAVWVESPTHGSECLRYWKGGFGSAPVKRAIVFFHGDVWLGTGISQTYAKLTLEKLASDANEWATKLGGPYLFFGRPGTHGSSGDHMQRRRLGESELISLALDQLKKRYGIEELVVAGQSGGGHVTVSLLAKRSDIVCAVPASSVSSPRARWILRGWNQDATGYADSYEPLQFLTMENKHPRLRIFVVGSVDDANTPWASQTLLSGRARALKLPVMELTGEGSGSQKHGMADSARLVAGWCAKDLSDPDIREKAKAGLKG